MILIENFVWNPAVFFHCIVFIHTIFYNRNISLRMVKSDLVFFIILLIIFIDCVRLSFILEDKTDELSSYT